MIGERVRDKIAASKRKGIWVGGPVPLGYRSRDKKLEVVPEEAELVRQIFGDYLALGSIGALAAKLNTEGPRPKPRLLANGKAVQAECWRVGPLAHLLKNRFDVGEVVYRGETHQGEHEPILDLDLFEAVQAKLQEQSVVRKLTRRQSPHLPTGKLFDDRGNLMSPTHANKAGVRYRYYTSQALLQGRKADAGPAGRVSAEEVEQAILKALRADRAFEPGSTDRDLIDKHVGRADLRRDCIAISMTATTLPEGDAETEVDAHPILLVPFAPTALPLKGLKHTPDHTASMNDADRISLLTTIARSKSWSDQLLRDPSLDFTAIAHRENLAERHVRFLAPLAYLSPRIVEAIADGRAPVGLAVRRIARDLSLTWAEQEAALGV